MPGMIRTQLYLSAEQHEQASRVAAESALSLSDIVRQALDEYLSRRRRQRKEYLDALAQVQGVWRDREDIPELPDLRRAWDRYPSWPPQP